MGRHPGAVELDGEKTPSGAVNKLLKREEKEVWK